MPISTHIRDALQQEILLMQGFKPLTQESAAYGILDPIRSHFPNAVFPLAVLHEFICTDLEHVSATAGFISGILSSLMKKGGLSVWIATPQAIFPPALKYFAIEPHHMLFISPKKEKEKLWVLEEALKCEGLSSVVAEINEISFTESRRFQLAAEQSRVTAFLIRRCPKNLATASVTRWKINHLPGDPHNDLPGLAFPKWMVELQKVRNGKPGYWQMEWKRKKFSLIQDAVPQLAPALKKIV